MLRKKQYESIYAGYTYAKPTTYWTPTDKLKESLTKVNLDHLDEIKVGGMPIIVEGKDVYIDDGDGHTVLIASSGMKKSICGFMPLILMLAAAQENMVITDPKGEIYNREAGLLEKQGYNVLCLDFRTMDKDCFNILYYATKTYRDGDKQRGLSLLSDVVSILGEEMKNNSKDIFWPIIAMQWLNATGSLMIDSFNEIDQVNMVNWDNFNFLGSYENLKNISAGIIDETIKAAMESCLSAADKAYQSILVTAAGMLAPFIQNPKLGAMLSHNTFTLEDLLKPKTALFLVTDDTTSTADAILGIIIRQIQTFLVDKAFQNPNGKLDIRMNFVLDEFASIPIPNMDKSLATHRSRNIRYYLCVQNLALLKSKYGEHEKLLSNCDSTLYLGSTELELLRELEVKLGTTCITPDGKERPLCSQSELMTLKKAWDYKEVIYMNLTSGTRYCTMLPSIERYFKETYPIPSKSKMPPKAEIYTVEMLYDDVKSGTIITPFLSAEKIKEFEEKEEKKRFGRYRRYN